MKAIDKKAYELAKRVLETVDWKNCDERRVLVVELKDGRRRFVSFLGSEGCFRAISLFADAAGFARLAMAEEDDALSIFDAFGSVEQLQLAFCPKEDLMPGEAEWIAASGLAFPDESHQFFSKDAFVPSKSTTASDGGFPGFSAGVTLCGFGRFQSCTAHACFASGVSP